MLRSFCLLGFFLSANALEISPCAEKADLSLQRLSTEPEELTVGSSFKADLVFAVEASAVDVRELHCRMTAVFCHRDGDCMRVFVHDGSFCNVFNLTDDYCSSYQRGDRIHAATYQRLPTNLFRGSYSAQLHIFHGKNEVSCSSVDDVIVTWHQLASGVRDVLDAVVAFGIASAASKLLGARFPVLSRGLLPQITGFLFIGILVGPFVTNLVTQYHIILIGKHINRISLSFIAGVAGAEIFYPDFEILMKPLMLKVALISVFTVVLCSVGITCLANWDFMTFPVIDMQVSATARVAVTVLVAACMTARSPASVIAVIKELKCEDLTSSKIAIGVTVFGDIVVLIMYAICCSICRVATEGGQFSPLVFMKVAAGLFLSLVLGVIAGQTMRWSISPDSSSEWRAVGVDEGVDNREAHATPLLRSNWDVFCLACRGVLLISILYVTFVIADDAIHYTNGIALEPLLTCTVASCLCGNDVQRRHRLEESLTFWVPHVFLPFFTLAGASLQLPALMRVLPAATAVVFFRLVAIASGSILAGLFSQRKYPELGILPTEVWCTWLTLIAQAGVTLGLVLEVEEKFKAWGQEFAALVIGIVVLNQLIGPICCQIGLRRIIAAREDDAAKTTAVEQPADVEMTTLEKPLDSQRTESMSARRPSARLGPYEKLN